MRSEKNSTSLLGLAVILPKYLNGKCQLVALDTMVHKSESFVERDSIKISFNCGFLSCALMSKSQAIVFTDDNAILVSLDDQV